MDLVKWLVPVLISAAAAVLAVHAELRARRAEQRTEHTAEMQRVNWRLEVDTFVVGATGRNLTAVALVHTGSEEVARVEVSAESLLRAAIAQGETSAVSVKPGEAVRFVITENSQLPASLRVDWSDTANGPLRWHCYVAVPREA